MRNKFPACHKMVTGSRSISFQTEVLRNILHMQQLTELVLAIDNRICLLIMWWQSYEASSCNVWCFLYRLL